MSSSQKENYQFDIIWPTCKHTSVTSSDLPNTLEVTGDVFGVSEDFPGSFYSLSKTSSAPTNFINSLLQGKFEVGVLACLPIMHDNCVKVSEPKAEV